jgi:hypothetical protein
MTQQIRLNGIEQIKQYLSANPIATYFISATNFNLQGIDQWVGKFKFINFIDCFDGKHTNVILPKTKSSIVFSSLEAINNYLLANKDIHDAIAPLEEALAPGDKSCALFLFFDQQSLEICQQLNLQLAFPPLDLIKSIDSKIVTTELGNEAGVASVPNALEQVTSYTHLQKLAKEHNLGDKVVVQTPFGDSGKTTYFVSDERSYKQHASEIEEAAQVKIMRQINCRGSAIEACITSCGTVVGPLLTELIGVPELTPYSGGWCGNEIYPGAFTQSTLESAQQKVIALGEQLRQRGYKGYFEVDFLTDLDTGELYLGEINPRITGVSAMTNLSAAAQHSLPPFLFHLLEYANIDYSFDIDSYNQYMLEHGNDDTWGQLIFKYTEDDLQIITAAPPSGIWQLEANQQLNHLSASVNRNDVSGANQGFFMRISTTGDYLYKGADMGILFIPQRLLDDKQQLTALARAWIVQIKQQFMLRDLTQEEQLLVARHNSPDSLKRF